MASQEKETAALAKKTIQPNVAAGSLHSAQAAIPRINSTQLFQQAREIEIDHQGRIYRLRLTNLNKLILTA